MRDRPAKSEGTESRREPVVVMNRDIPVLCDILPVMQLVCATERNLDWQHDRMTAMSQHISGMPGGGTLPQGLDEAFARLYEAGEDHAKELMQYQKELREAEQILNGIENRSMRAFVVMKYVMDAPDTEIRRELNMTEWGFNRARKAVEEAENMASVVWREKYIVQNGEKNFSKTT